MKQMILSIGRQCGSGGHEIGEKLAKHYGIHFYDRNIIALLAEKMDKDPEAVSRLEEKLSGFLLRRGGFDAKQKDLMNRLSDTDRLFIQERRRSPSSSSAAARTTFCWTIPMRSVCSFMRRTASASPA